MNPLRRLIPQGGKLLTCQQSIFRRNIVTITNNSSLCSSTFPNPSFPNLTQLRTKVDIKGPPRNEEIKADPVRIVFVDPETKENLWKNLSLKEALDFAKSTHQDLVLVNPQLDPPICKLMKAANPLDKKKETKAPVIKELLIRQGIDPHDFHIKVNKGIKMLKSENTILKISLINSFRLQTQIVNQKVKALRLDETKTSLDLQELIRTLSPLTPPGSSSHNVSIIPFSTNRKFTHLDKLSNNALTDVNHITELIFNSLNESDSSYRVNTHDYYYEIPHRPLTFEQQTKPMTKGAPVRKLAKTLDDETRLQDVATQQEIRKRQIEFDIPLGEISKVHDGVTYYKFFSKREFIIQAKKDKNKKKAEK